MATDMPTKKLFISHASVDKAFVNQLVARLRDDHIDVWYDTFDVNAMTADLHERFRAGVADAEFFAIVLTPRSQASQWVSYEANTAMDQNKPILAVVADAPSGYYDFLRNPHVNDLLRGGRRVVVDFTTDFERGLDDLLAVLDPEVGRKRVVERNLRVILEAEDPDAAETAMTEAGLYPHDYLPRLTSMLPALRDNAKTSYRVERAMTYLGEPAIDSSFAFLLRQVDIPSVPIPTEIPHTRGDDEVTVFKGDAFSDVLRHVILTGGNRAWAAQIGAQRCLLAAGRRDPLVRADIQQRLHAVLKELLQIVTVSKHDGKFTDAFFDAARLSIETLGLLEDGRAVTDPWLIEQFVTTTLWGKDQALSAKDKLTSYAVECLARLGSRDALTRLLSLADDAQIHELYFSDITRGNNPWESCFAKFGNEAVDSLLPWITEERNSFRRVALLNLASISNLRGLRAVMDAIVNPRADETPNDLAKIALRAAGRGIPEICDRIIREFNAGAVDQAEFEKAAALAAKRATDKSVVADLCVRLASSTDLWTTWYVVDAVATQQIYSCYEWLHVARRDGRIPALRGKAAIALAEVRSIDAPQLKAQLAGAESATERPYVSVALAELGDAGAIEGLVEGLKSSFLQPNDLEHELFAESLLRLNTDAAKEARRKWYRRV